MYKNIISYDLFHQSMKHWRILHFVEMSLSLLKMSLLWFFLASTTAHPYITFTSASVSPSPIVIPGNILIGLRGTVHHNFGNEDRMVVRIDKLLLGQWVIIPCAYNMGSWYFFSNDKTSSFFLKFHVSNFQKLYQCDKLSSITWWSFSGCGIYFEYRKWNRTFWLVASLKFSQTIWYIVHW